MGESKLLFMATALPYWKMVGYLLYIIIFMVMCNGFHDYPKEEWRSVVYKALPIVHLVFIVYNTEFTFKHFTSYRSNVLLGLLLSIGGDACLVWRLKLFLPGLFFFALAQVCYARAFGMRPTGPAAGFVCLLAAGGMYLWLLPAIDEPLLKGLVLVYSLLIGFMAWRSLALYQGSPTVGTFCGCFGAFVFILSDFIIAVDKWVGTVDKAPLVVMCTYYTAQLFIALSAACYSAPPWVTTEEEDRDSKKRA